MVLERMKAARKVERDVAKQTVNPDPIDAGQSLNLGDHNQELPDVYADKATELRFHTHLTAQDPVLAKSIIRKLATDEVLTDAERRFQKDNMRSFGVQNAVSEKAAEILTDDELEPIIDGNADLAGIMVQIKPQSAGYDLVRTLLKEHALKDPAKFKLLTNQLREIRTIDKGRGLRAEREATEALRKYKISDEEYQTSIRSSMHLTGGHISAETETRFEAFAQQHMGILAKFRNMVTGGKALAERKHELEQAFFAERYAMQDRERYTRQLGVLLRGTFDADVLKSIQKSMVTGQPIERPQEQGINTLREFRELRDTTREASNQRLKTHIATETARLGVANIDDLTEAQQTAITDSFVPAEAAVQKKEKKNITLGSFFSSLMSYILPSEATIRKTAKKVWS